MVWQKEFSTFYLFNLVPVIFSEKIGNKCIEVENLKYTVISTYSQPARCYFGICVLHRILTKCFVNISDNSCYNGSGETYAGRKNVSKSGRPCRAWPTMDPPGHNFCRNPDGHRTRPWCYVGQDNEKESCDVKKCSTIGK